MLKSRSDKSFKQFQHRLNLPEKGLGATSKARAELYIEARQWHDRGTALRRYGMMPTMTRRA